MPLNQLPTSRKTVGCNWDFKIKYKANGEVDFYKAKFVAKSQVKGVDYHDTFSHVVKITTFHNIFAIVSIRNLEFHQINVITAFLIMNLIEIIFMDQPGRVCC